jgi:hypothetical protein
MDLTNIIDESVTTNTLDFAKKWFDVLNINTTNFPLLVVKIIEHVENYKTLTGFEKRDLVIETLTKILNNTDVLDDKNKNNLLKILPNTIETFIKVSNGEFIKNLKKHKLKHKNKYQIDVADISGQLVKRLLSIIDTKNQNIKYLVENSTMIILEVMNILEEFPTLSGVEKKSLAIKIFQTLLTHPNINNENLDPIFSDLLLTTNELMPSLMEIIISISKGNFELNQQHINKCLSMCGPLFMKCFGSVLKKCMKKKNDNHPKLDDVMKKLENEKEDIKIISEIEIDNKNNVTEKISKIHETEV